MFSDTWVAQWTRQNPADARPGGPLADALRLPNASRQSHWRPESSLIRDGRWPVAHASTNIPSVCHLLLVKV